MVQKLGLTFPLLSDPGGETAAKPLEVWNPETDLPHPSALLFGPDGGEAWRSVGHDFAERVLGDELAERVRGFGWPAVECEPPAPGEPRPSERAFPVEAMLPYYRGARYAGKAIAGRVPEAEQAAERYGAQLDALIEAAESLKGD